MKNLVALSVLICLVFAVSVCNAANPYTGLYTGTFSGAYTGEWLAEVESDGSVHMLFYVATAGVMDGIEEATIGVSGRLIATTINGAGLIDLQFAGSNVSGTWMNPDSSSGTLSGSKQTNVAKYAGTYSGVISGADTGTWEIHISTDGSFSGSMTSQSSGTDNVNGGIGNSGMFMAVTGFGTGCYGHVTGSNVTGSWYDDDGAPGGTITGQKTGDATASYTYYIPVFKPSSTHWIGMGITNLSAAGTAAIQATVYNKTGTVFRNVSKTIPANGQASFMLSASSPTNGWIKIVSDRKVAGLCFLGQYTGPGESTYHIADVPFTDSASKNLIIPHSAQNSRFDTTVFLANAKAYYSNVTMTYTNKSGTASSPYSANVHPNGSIEVPLSTIAGSTNISGGYVRITASREAAAFALYNNLKSSNYGFAGISAVPID